MSWALRVFVPLNSRCSKKWLEPLIAGASSREPARTQTPSDTERTPGIRSVTTRRPDVYSVRWIVMCGLALLGAGGVSVRSPPGCRGTDGRAACRRRRHRCRSARRSARRRRSPAALAAATAATVLTRPTLAAAAFGSVPSGTSHSGPTGFRLILPWASMSSTSTVSLSPSLTASSTLCRRLPRAELRDVDQAVAAGNQVHERAERGRLHDRALVGLAHQDRTRVRDLVDHVRGLVGTLAAGRRADEHGPVVLDVDVRSGQRDDLVDPLALGPDDLADLVDRDLDRDDPRRLRVDLVARRRRSSLPSCRGS